LFSCSYLNEFLGADPALVGLLPRVAAGVLLHVVLARKAPVAGRAAELLLSCTTFLLILLLLFCLLKKGQLCEMVFLTLHPTEGDYLGSKITIFDIGRIFAEIREYDKIL
jgi:hypothetical protein